MTALNVRVDDIVTLTRVRSFGEHWQIELGQVDHLDVENAARGGLFGDPLSRGFARAVRPGARDQDLNEGTVCHRPGHERSGSFPLAVSSSMSSGLTCSAASPPLP